MIQKSRSVAALHYQDLTVSNNPARFIESETVPGDSSVVGETWRYVNRKGGPDRRFNFNKQLPICLYGEMEFKSQSGLNCKIQFSKRSAAERLSKAIEILHRPQSLLHSKPITSYGKAKRWPTIVFSCCLLLGGVILAALFYEPIGLAAPLTDTKSPNLVTNSIPKISNQPTAPLCSTSQFADRKPQQDNSQTMPLVITPVLTPTAVTPSRMAPKSLDVPLPRPRP